MSLRLHTILLGGALLAASPAAQAGFPVQRPTENASVQLVPLQKPDRAQARLDNSCSLLAGYAQANQVGESSRALIEACGKNPDRELCDDTKSIMQSSPVDRKFVQMLRCVGAST